MFINSTSVQQVTVKGEEKKAYIFTNVTLDAEEDDGDDSYYLMCEGEDRQIEIKSATGLEGPESMASNGAIVYIVMNRAGKGNISSLSRVNLEDGTSEWIPLRKLWPHIEMPRVEFLDDHGDVVALWGMKNGAVIVLKSEMDRMFREFHEYNEACK